MIVNVKIDLSNPMALPLLGYLESLPFAEVKNEKQSFEEAVKECNGIPLDAFIDELRRYVNEQYEKRGKSDA